MCVWFFLNKRNAIPTSVTQEFYNFALKFQKLHKPLSPQHLITNLWFLSTFCVRFGVPNTKECF